MFLASSSLVRSTEEAHPQSEREHALRWVRLTMEDHVGAVTLGVARAIVAVADADGDKLRGVFLETLAELCKNASADVSGRMLRHGFWVSRYPSPQPGLRGRWHPHSHQGDRGQRGRPGH